MAQFPTSPKGALINGNDNLHSLTDSNMGGSPRPDHKKNIPQAQKGGFGQQGRDKVYVRASMGSGRGSSGNPASRGGFSGVARGGNFQPETRVPKHGGSPQVREREQGKFGMRGGMGANGQGGVNRHTQGQLPSYTHANPAPKAGNTSGLAYKRIAGRFKRAAMGAQANQGSSGKYGSAPVTANT